MSSGPRPLDWERTGRDWVARSRTRPGQSWVLVGPPPTVTASGALWLSDAPYTVNLVNDQTDECAELGTAPTRGHAARLASRADWIFGCTFTVKRVETVIREHDFTLDEFVALLDRPPAELVAAHIQGSLSSLVSAELDDGYEHPDQPHHRRRDHQHRRRAALGGTEPDVPSLVVRGHRRRPHRRQPRPAGHSGVHRPQAGAHLVRVPGRPALHRPVSRSYTQGQPDPFPQIAEDLLANVLPPSSRPDPQLEVESECPPPR